MPMEKEKHEALLAELLNPELEQSRRTEVLQELRVDYGGVLIDFDTMKTASEKLTKDNADLVVANSKLFRQLGITDNNSEEKKKQEEKTLSETITIEQLEKA